MQILNRTPLRSRIAAACALIAAASLISCATPPPPRQETIKEKVRREKVLGVELASQFENGIRIRKDSELEVYLRKLTLSLSAEMPELADAGAGVILVDDIQGKWRSFALPGNRIYLSVSLLKKFSYENEVAALIALQLGHLQGAHLLDRIYQKNSETGAKEVSATKEVSTLAPQPGTLPNKIDFFGPGGAFDFTEEQVFQAITTAVPLLYDHGYDPRGVLSIWKAHAANLKRSPYDEIMVSKAGTRTRNVLAERPPLRNPVVNRESFKRILKRIEKL